MFKYVVRCIYKKKRLLSKAISFIIKDSATCISFEFYNLPVFSKQGVIIYLLFINSRHLVIRSRSISLYCMRREPFRCIGKLYINIGRYALLLSLVCDNQYINDSI